MRRYAALSTLALHISLNVLARWGSYLVLEWGLQGKKRLPLTFNLVYTRICFKKCMYCMNNYNCLSDHVT